MSCMYVSRRVQVLERQRERDGRACCMSPSRDVSVMKVTQRWSSHQQGLVASYDINSKMIATSIFNSKACKSSTSWSSWFITPLFIHNLLSFSFLDIKFGQKSRNLDLDFHAKQAPKLPPTLTTKKTGFRDFFLPSRL